MRTLLLLRHAKSSWEDEALADHDRPLAKRGLKAAPRMGRVLQHQDLVPDQVLCSSATRARETARLALAETQFVGTVRFNGDLYHAAPDAILRVLRDADTHARRVLVVGHNPGFEQLLALLLGEEVRVPTAALAVVKLPIAEWLDLKSDVRGLLTNFWRPKSLE